jgi:hypothetical protein
MVFEAIERGVIAKSPAGDEAIQSLQPTPVIVPATSGRSRWFAMTTHELKVIALWHERQRGRA